MGFKPLLSQHDLDLAFRQSITGGLIIAGSYVPKTTAQLKVLRERQVLQLNVIELDVQDLIKSDMNSEKAIEEAARSATKSLTSGKDVLVMTSRKLITGADAIASLDIGGVVADALVRILQNIHIRPRYIIAKVSMFLRLTALFFDG